MDHVRILNEHIAQAKSRLDACLRDEADHCLDAQGEDVLREAEAVMAALCRLRVAFRAPKEVGR